jgi:hypothetical protein
MPIDRPLKKSVALVLAGAALGLTTPPGAAAAADNQANPNATPPILRPARPSELAAIRRAEAQRREAFYYRLPESARYSLAELNAFASEGYGGG